MFLTLALLSRRWTPGKQWIGKHRRIKKFALTRKINKSKRSAIAREVDQFVRRPYLTTEQELNSSMVSNRKWNYDKMIEARKRFKTLLKFAPGSFHDDQMVLTWLRAFPTILF